MTMLTPDTLEKLLVDEHPEEAELCVSIYLPTHRSEPEARQDPIRLKNLLRSAEEALEERGLRKPEIDALLERARARVTDELFWHHQKDGLAVLIRGDETIELKLPITVEEICVVNHRFYLAPLLRALSGDGRFYILALSQDDVRLLSATRDEVRPVELRDVPRSLEDALGSELYRLGIQWHTRTPSPIAGERRAVFHGHGAGDDDVEHELRRYVQMVDRALLQELPDRTAPLVVAAVERMAALYHHECLHPNLVPGWVEGGVDHLDDHELHRRAWPLVEPLFRARQDQALQRYGQMEDADRASTDLQDVLRAAEEGRVETLFIAEGEHRWGTYDPTRREIEIHPEQRPGAEDLLERAAVTSLRFGAEVYVESRERMPRGAPVAALYRFRSLEQA